MFGALEEFEVEGRGVGGLAAADEGGELVVLMDGLR